MESESVHPWSAASSLKTLPFLPQIKALRREHVETILEKEELVDDPTENGIMLSLICWLFAGFRGLVKLNHPVLTLLFYVLVFCFLFWWFIRLEILWLESGYNMNRQWLPSCEVLRYCKCERKRGDDDDETRKQTLLYIIANLTSIQQLLPNNSWQTTKPTGNLKMSPLALGVFFVQLIDDDSNHKLCYVFISVCVFMDMLFILRQAVKL